MLVRISAFLLVLLLAAPARAADDFCFECHGIQEGTSARFKNDIHYASSLSCVDCHGGDPTLNDMNTPKTPQKGFRLRVQREEVPLFCSGCHSNEKFMARYKPKPVTNQYALYTHSVHGRKLAAGKTEAAQCGDCHGDHDIRQASDPASKTHARHISETCGTCHNETAAAFKGTPHDRGNRATCVACHGSHDIQEATSALLTGDGGCETCHRANSRPMRAAVEIAALIKELEDKGPESKNALTAAKRAAHKVNANAVRQAIESATTRPAAATQPATRPGGRPSP